MAAVEAHIVHPVDVNRRLLAVERQRGVQIMRFALLMERAESWTIDDIRTDSQGFPIAVNDERGTAEERLQGVARLEDALNSEAFRRYLREHAHDQEVRDFDERLIEVMALLRTSRFVVCVEHMSGISSDFVTTWVRKIDKCAREGNVLAHVLRERLRMLKRANLVRAVFSKEAVGQVTQILEGMQT